MQEMREGKEKKQLREGQAMDPIKFITVLYKLVANKHGAEIKITKIEKLEPEPTKEKQPA